MAEHPAAWLEEILHAAGDTRPAIRSKIQQAAESTYQQRIGDRGEAWAQYEARRTAKSILAAAATDSDPEVQTAFCKYQEARDHAGRLYAVAVGLNDETAWKWVDADLADHRAKVLYEEYGEAWQAARPRHDAEVRKAWRKADMDFARSRRTELKTADPDGFSDTFWRFTPVVTAGARSPGGRPAPSYRRAVSTAPRPARPRSLR